MDHEPYSQGSDNNKDQAGGTRLGIRGVLWVVIRNKPAKEEMESSRVLGSTRPTAVQLTDETRNRISADKVIVHFK